MIVLHGGPGAPGHVAPVARELGKAFRALEPWQRGSGEEPLTVARHVDDLHEVIASRCNGERPALVGSSWGAMLALAFAAEHPSLAGPLVLVGCGTFDVTARKRMEQLHGERIDDELRRRLERMTDECSDPNERLRVMGKMMLPVYCHDIDPADWKADPCDAKAYRETWRDMLRLQEQGVYPAAFAAIESPVLMLHGDYDPHPGRMILASLEPHIRRLEYREWERCGHYPWLERTVRDEFYAVLREWLSRHS